MSTITSTKTTTSTSAVIVRPAAVRHLQILRFAIDGLPSVGITTLLNSFYQHYSAGKAFGLNVSPSATSHGPNYFLQIFVRPTVSRSMAAADDDSNDIKVERPADASIFDDHLDIQLGQLRQLLKDEASFITNHPHLLRQTRCVVIIYERSPFYYLYVYLPHLYLRWVLLLTMMVVVALNIPALFPL